MRREKTAFEQYVKTLTSQPPLALDEEMTIYYNLFIPGNNNIKLVNRLIESHMPLAVKIARQYTGRGMKFEDLLDITVSETVRLAHIYNPGVTHKHRFGTILPSRLKKALRLAFIETKKFQSQGLFDQVTYSPDMELCYTVKKILMGCFTEDERAAILYRWEGNCTLSDTLRLVGKSQSWILKRENDARKLIKEALDD